MVERRGVRVNDVWRFMRTLFGIKALCRIFGPLLQSLSGVILCREVVRLSSCREVVLAEFVWCDELQQRFCFVFADSPFKMNLESFFWVTKMKGEELIEGDEDGSGVKVYIVAFCYSSLVFKYGEMWNHKV